MRDNGARQLSTQIRLSDNNGHLVYGICDLLVIFSPLDKQITNNDGSGLITIESAFGKGPLHRQGWSTVYRLAVCHGLNLINDV